MIEHLKVVWCRMTHTGVEIHKKATGETVHLNGVQTTTVYVRCLECGRAK